MSPHTHVPSSIAKLLIYLFCVNTHFSLIGTALLPQILVLTNYTMPDKRAITFSGNPCIYCGYLPTAFRVHPYHRVSLLYQPFNNIPANHPGKFINLHTIFLQIYIVWENYKKIYDFYLHFHFKMI